jgi:DNA repair protein SbcD/Mre11
MSRVKVLVAGDLHIGRVSSRVSTGDLAGVSARCAWDRIVDLALEEAVDVVCLTGDVADESNRFWEALGPLERGLRKLEEHGIATLAVCGNHDYDALPRLADQLESDAFRLLGRGGEWERHTLSSEGSPLLHIDGWSFPRERVRNSPVDSYNIPEDPSTPTLVMVHGDLNVPDSPYAPLNRERMLARRVAGWLLGHIHAPMIDEPEGLPFIVYPGSPQALDPGESGVHGVVIVEFEHGRCLGVRGVPLSTVRFDSFDVDVSGVDDQTALTTRVRDEIEAFAERAAQEGDVRLRHLVLRLTLRGQTSIADELSREAKQICEDFELEASGVTCSVDRVTLRVLPTIDLEALGRVRTPPGMLASVLTELRQDKSLGELSERTQRLAERVRMAVTLQRRLPVFSGVGEAESIGDEDVRELVCEQVESILIQLLQEQE